MKKVFVFVGLALAVSASAQYERQAGDISLSIDATPVLNYVGNVFGNTNNTHAGQIFQDNTIVGKYFLSENSALRVDLNFGFNTTTTKTLVNDVTSTATPPAQVTNVGSVSNNNFNLGVAYELHRGTGRLQGFYGAGVNVGLTSQATSNTPGNKISATYPQGKTSASGSAFQFGVGGFAGVEFYVAKNISLGGQVGLGLDYLTAGKGKTSVETWDVAAGKATTTDIEQYYAPARFNLATRGSGIFVSFYW